MLGVNESSIKKESIQTEKELNHDLADSKVSTSDFSSIPSFKKEHQLSKKLRWKIYFQIMPLFILVYFFQFLDKTLLNYAAVMGITKYLKGNEYSNLSTIFYVSYLAMEPFAGICIQKLPVAKFLGVNVIIWGIVVSCHAATKTYAGLMIVRTLLGLCEASAGACLIVITGMWWTKKEQSQLTGLWFMQIGTAQIIGALISFGFQHVHTTTIESWQILFIVIGIITALLGVAVLIFLPDNPLTCKFLTEGEKQEVIDHIRINQTGVENRKYKFYQVKEILFKDKQTWLLFFIVLLSLINGGAITTFSSIILESFGFDHYQSTFMQFPSGVITIISALLCCYLPSYIGERCLIVSFISLLSLIGIVLQISLDASQKAGRLIGVYLMNFNGALVALVYTWGAINTSGHTKRITRNTMTLMAFCIGCLLGPQQFRSKNAPNYTPGKIALIAELAVVIVLALILRIVIIKENKSRDEKYRDLPPEIRNRDATFLDITDIENVNFRYSH